MPVEDFSLSIAGVEIAGRRWRNGAPHANTRPVLALHGWLDNAASFDALAPLLPDTDLVALDLAGHGWSYHRTPQSTYNVWDDLPDLVRVADALGWTRFHLLGHSRGAIIAALLTAALPERILGTVLLDGLTPPPLPVADTFAQLGRHLQEHLREPRVPARYESRERALEVRCRVGGIGPEAAWPIVERGLRLVGDSWQWRADPRLNFASAFKLSAEQIELLLKILSRRPHLLVMAEEGLAKRMVGSEQLEGLNWRCLPGGHHFHLEGDAVEAVAGEIAAFWQVM
jgi:pimeloyl-ACP methyl ester carboxylesterase